MCRRPLGDLADLPDHVRLDYHAEGRATRKTFCCWHHFMRWASNVVAVYEAAEVTAEANARLTGYGEKGTL